MKSIGQYDQLQTCDQDEARKESLRFKTGELKWLEALGQKCKALATSEKIYMPRALQR
jgi:hypothetical protein